MKITLDKNVITLAEVATANNYAKENAWIADKEVIKTTAIACLEKYYGTGKEIFDVKLIGMPDVKITKNHYDLTVWCECCVWYWRDGKDHVAKLSYDLTRACEQTIECFIIVLDQVDCRCI